VDGIRESEITTSVNFPNGLKKGLYYLIYQGNFRFGMVSRVTCSVFCD